MCHRIDVCCDFCFVVALSLLGGLMRYALISLQWRHNKRDGVANDRRLYCLLNCWFRRRSKEYLSSASLAFVRGIHRRPMNSPHKKPVTRKNNRAPFKCCFKLCASFHSHQSIQTGVTVRKRQIWVKISDIFVPCDLEFWRMTLRKIGHLSYAVSSFVHHFIAIGEFKLELQSGNAQFGSNSTILLAP